jgi:hypothetical protein
VNAALTLLGASLVQTALDVLPIAFVIVAFQAWAFRRIPPEVGRIVLGFAAMVAGISFFRAGLGLSLIPMGDDLARHLARRIAAPEHSTFLNALWLVSLAASLGLAATLIEPTLTGVAQRVHELTDDAPSPFTFRIVVAIGVAVGLALGTIRILIGLPYLHLLAPLLVFTGVLALRAPRRFVPLALDSGPVATSVATVPIIAAFGAALARYLPNRDPLADGFGLVFLALMLPVTFLLIHARIAAIRERERERRSG